MIRQPLTIAELGNKGVRYDHAPQTDRRKKHLAECYDADDTLGIKFPNRGLLRDIIRKFTFKNVF